MTETEAQRVIESLRKGIPPDGYVRSFTVGRASEIRELEAKLSEGSSDALLLQANYGAGKTHLLRYLRELALEEGFVVSTVHIDSKSAVRFNRMDQILGAVCRGIKVPGEPNAKGVPPLLDHVCEHADADFWQELSNGGRWDYSEELESAAMFVAVRAWANAPSDAEELLDLIEDWLSQPWTYYSQRKRLYEALVEDLRDRFREPRPDWQFYSDGVFVFNTNDYAQSWGALRDIHVLALASGLKGFVILFDEFEDVVRNLRNISYQEKAFWNLFRFFSGKDFRE